MTTICIQSDDSTPEHENVSSICSSSSTSTSSSTGLCSQSSLDNIASFHCPRTATPTRMVSTWHTTIDKKKPMTTRPQQSQKEQQTHHLMQQYKDWYATIKGEFLVPANYQGHVHEWVQLDAGMTQEGRDSVLRSLRSQATKLETQHYCDYREKRR